MDKILCKIFGHKYDVVDRFMFLIQFDALNREQLNVNITCKRCGEVTTKILAHEVRSEEEENGFNHVMDLLQHKK